jgi:DNA polymerase-3 subunit gamma/tau
VALPEAERPEVKELARRMGLASVVRYMEVLGKAQVDMREAPDPRVHLEVVLIRLTHPEADDSPAALLERIERLERGGAGGASPASQSPPAVVDEPRPEPSRPPAARARKNEPPAPSESTPAPTDPGPASAEPSDSSSPALSGPDLARQTLGALKKQSTGRKAPGRPEAAAPANRPTPASGATDTLLPPSGPPPGPTMAPPANGVASAGSKVLSRDDLVQLWGDSLLASLPNRARARFRVGRFVAVDGGTAVFALPNETHRSYCEEVRLEVESALGQHFGTVVPLRLVVDEEADATASPRGGAPTSRAAADAGSASDDVGGHSDGPDLLDPVVLAAETELAGKGLSPEERLKQAFPGAEQV